MRIKQSLSLYIISYWGGWLRPSVFLQSVIVLREIVCKIIVTIIVC